MNNPNEKAVVNIAKIKHNFVTLLLLIYYEPYPNFFKWA